MPIQVTIGGVPYNIPVTGERGWGDDSTTLLQRLALEADEFATGVYNLTSDIDLNDASGLFGIRSNFYKGKGNIPDDGFLRIAHPSTESSQPYIFTKITWRNSTNDANLALFPTDDEFLEFDGVALADVSGTQTFTNKTATDLVLDNEVSGSAIITDVALAGAADTLLASSLAIKTYVDNAAAGQDDASEITYTPANNPDWDVVPAFVAPALDELASRVIADGAVTSDKLATDSVITAKIADANVTNAKLASDIDATKLASGTVADARLSANVNLLDADQTVSGEKTYDKVVLGDSIAINNNASSTLAEPDKSVVRLTGTPVPGFTSLQTITATGVTTNRCIQLQNDTASTFALEDGTGNLVTGTGQNLELAPQAVVILRYDGTNWRVIGGSGGGAGGIATEFYIHSALPATLSPDIRYIVDISGGDAAATMPASDALNDGKVIEVWPVNNPGGGEIVLTAAGSHNFNDPDLGLDTEYVLDVSSAEFVIRDTGDLYEVRDAYWAAGFDLADATTTTAGVVKQNRWGRQDLGAAVTTTDTSFLQFDNLTVGRMYRYSGVITIERVSGTDIGANLVRARGTVLPQDYWVASLDPASSDNTEVKSTAGFSLVFKAEASGSIYLETFSFAAGVQVTDEVSSIPITFAQLEELNNYDDTNLASDFT